jgi:AAA family ATPase
MISFWIFLSRIGARVDRLLFVIIKLNTHESYCHIAVTKKKYIHHIAHLSGNQEEKETEIFLSDVEDKGKIHEFPTASEKVIKDDEKTIKQLYLAPAGFPIKPIDSPDVQQLQIKDPKLFQAYASEQWISLTVSIEDYIFDQLLIPDYAFKILKLVPKNAHRIGIETNFHLVQEEPPKPKFRPVTFNEIVGNHQALEKARIIAEFLKHPDKFGKWAPRNILFYGPPGTGKTLTAKAIASDASCTFIARKGTTLIGLHVGDGASKIHGLFAEAKANAPAIIFIDELDSIGLNRSFQSVRGDVIEVATALLSELDGLEENTNVITIAATNSIDLIDPGLRSRFEEEIEFPLPSEQERIALLRLFSKDLPIKVNANLELIAKRIDKWSGRDIHEKLMKVSLHKAIQNKLDVIDTDLLIKVIDQAMKQLREDRVPPHFFS